MTYDLEQAFKKLRIGCGSHRRAARKLGLSPGHYRKMRNGRTNITARAAEYIILKASELDGGATGFSSSVEYREARP